MEKKILLDTEKVYELFSQTYFAMKAVQEADCHKKKVFGIKSVREQFCGNWNVICLLGLRDEYYAWKKLCGFENEGE